MGARLSEHADIAQAITAMVRKRVPPSEVDDIVPSTLAEAVASPEAPADKDALRRWLSGVARHKVADFHRRRRREVALDSAPELPGGSTPHPVEERDLLRWARRQLPSDEAQQTLDWMMHEADGEKLEAIAERERIPATRVRQRVSRLRAFFRERWHRELALASVLVLVIVVGWIVARRDGPHAPPIAHDPPRVIPRAEILRGEAESECARGAWRACLDKLDEAKRLDPAGDETPKMRESRRAAERALEPPPPPIAPPIAPSSTAKPSPGPVPTSSAPPVTKPRGPSKRTPEGSSLFPSDFGGTGSSAAGSK